jgi:hypothetical protein
MPTLAIVYPLFIALDSHLERFGPGSGHSPAVRRAAQVAQDKLDKYFESMPLTGAIATMLDPRFKKAKLVEFHRNAAIAMLSTIFRRDYVEAVDVPAPVDEPEEGFTSLLFPSSKRTRIDPSDEIETYFNEELVRDEAGFCPIRWWGMRKSSFCNLSRMARDYLAIPGTSTTSERMFSQARHITTDIRASLSPLTIQAVMCLKLWMKNPYMAAQVKKYIKENAH